MVAKPRALSAPAVVLPSTMPGRGEPERREVLLDTALSLQDTLAQPGPTAELVLRATKQQQCANQSALRSRQRQANLLVSTAVEVKASWCLGGFKPHPTCLAWSCFLPRSPSPCC
jgi:hypothetical protein